LKFYRDSTSLLEDTEGLSGVGYSIVNRLEEAGPLIEDGECALGEGEVIGVGGEGAYGAGGGYFFARNLYVWYVITRTLMITKRAAIRSDILSLS
jgi:hypothetical protein